MLIDRDDVPHETLTEDEARTYMEDKVLRHAAAILKRRAERERAIAAMKKTTPRKRKKKMLKRCEECGAYKFLTAALAAKKLPSR